MRIGRIGHLALALSAAGGVVGAFALTAAAATPTAFTSTIRSTSTASCVDVPGGTTDINTNVVGRAHRRRRTKLPVHAGRRSPGHLPAGQSGQWAVPRAVPLECAAGQRLHLPAAEHHLPDVGPPGRQCRRPHLPARTHQPGGVDDAPLHRCPRGLGQYEPGAVAGLLRPQQPPAGVHHPRRGVTPPQAASCGFDTVKDGDPTDSPATRFPSSLLAPTLSRRRCAPGRSRCHAGSRCGPNQEASA